ncbi:MAG: thioredoxin domain-containing protein [Bacteroidota bacterium]|nr:thioredoxin domain-containing protein [Bacteroidota bacterium]
MVFIKKIFLFSWLFVMLLQVCGQDAVINQKNSSEFVELINIDGGILLDVRTKHEFKNEHIEDSGQLNYYAFDFRKKLLMLPKDQPIYLYCNTGYRSEKAAKILINNGYSNVYNLEHGIMEWNLQNYPTVTEADAHPDLVDKFDFLRYKNLLTSDSLVFIDFYAPWCAPCIKMMPMIDSLMVEYNNKIKIVKINADASKKLIKKLKIIGVPYLVLYYKGQLLFYQNGEIRKEELQAIFDSQIRRSKRNRRRV